MFKYRPLIILLQLLPIFVACNTVVEKPDNTDVNNHNHVMHKTDSILVLADEGFKIMKKEKLEQRTFVDSLQHTIEIEQFTINDLNNKVKRISDIDKDLQLTKEQLEMALINCKNKEKELIELNEKFELKSEQFMSEIEYYIDREVKLVIIYEYKIDSLVKKIGVLENDVDIIDFLEERTNKKRRKNKKSEN